MPGRWSSAVGSLLVVGLLLASLLLALVRVTDPGAQRLVELAALSPLGLPIAGLALLGAAAWWTVPRRARVAAALAATGLLAVHAWWLAPLYVGPRPAGGPTSLVVLAQNFEYGDPAAVVRLVGRENVDVLVLTDAGTARAEELLAAGIEAQLPWSAGIGKEGAVVLSRVPVARAESLYAQSESQLIELVVPGLGNVTLAALHTAPPYRPEDWRTDHDRIRAALAGIRARSDAVVVLAGDLNATLAHAPVQRLLELGFADAAVQANSGWSPTWPSGGHEERFGLTVPAFAAIDHVLTSPRLVVTRSETVDLAGADHLGVLATISAAVPDAG